MVLAERAVLQFFTLLFCINGLDSAPRDDQNTLGVLSELLGKDSKSPLIVVVDPSNHARNLDEDDHSHTKNCKHSSHKRIDTSSISKDAYEAVLYDILRTSQLVLENQEEQDQDNRDRDPDNRDRDRDRDPDNRDRDRDRDPDNRDRDRDYPDRDADNRDRDIDNRDWYARNGDDGRDYDFPGQDRQLAEQCSGETEENCSKDKDNEC